MLESIPPTGLSVIFQPESGLPLVDIVLVHGLKGHPYKTWTSPRQDESSQGAQTPEKKKKTGVFSPISWFRKKPLNKETWEDESVTDASEGAGAKLFWPADLLPQDCPNARILSYGYDTKITKYMSGPTNKNSLFSHSKDFLFVLSRNRIHNRKLIFLAHSLGGIVVKEMLSRSSASMDADLVNIVESTAAVIFLGTPHRGSPDLSSLGEWARSVLSILRMDTAPAILDTLGLKTTDLERAQEGFSALWQKYDFRVKTFQEGLGLTGVNLGVLGNKVVPDTSSLIGDQREHAETLQANHMEMCRFTGRNDPNYLKVSGELRSIYLSILSIGLQSIHERGQMKWAASDSRTYQGVSTSPKLVRNDSNVVNEPSKRERACLESLRFPTMNRRRQTILNPMLQTCDWLVENDTYQDWFHNRSIADHGGLLLLKGNPGTGKSTLMKEAFHRASQNEANSDYCTASFFFDAKGDELQRNPTGLLRSILYQLLPHYPEQLRDLSYSLDWTGKVENTDNESLEIQQAQLESFVRTMFSRKLAKRAIVFIDALDESVMSRPQLYFWREVTRLGALYRQLNVCISLKHFPAITVSNCFEISVEHHNKQDIWTYVDRKLSMSLTPSEKQKWKTLHETVLKMSDGVFLWVVLVVDDLLKKWDEGKGTKFLLEHLQAVPPHLTDLFETMVHTLGWENRQLTLRVFQWALLSSRPLRLHEWHHVLGFLHTPPPFSLHDWRSSVDFTESDEQLERAIRNLSGGLLEVSSWRSEEPPGKDAETMSVLAGAGSLDFEQGGTRIIQVIHQSVREFFLNGGFSIIDPTVKSNPVGNAHISIMNTCLDYLAIPELDTLIRARERRIKDSSVLPFENTKFMIGDTYDDSDSDSDPDSPEENAIEDDDGSSDWEDSVASSEDVGIFSHGVNPEKMVLSSRLIRAKLARNHHPTIPLRPDLAIPQLSKSLPDNSPPSLHPSIGRRKATSVTKGMGDSPPNLSCKVPLSNIPLPLRQGRGVMDSMTSLPLTKPRKMTEAVLTECLHRHLSQEKLQKSLSFVAAPATGQRRHSFHDLASLDNFENTLLKATRRDPPLRKHSLTPSVEEKSEPWRDPSPVPSERLKFVRKAEELEVDAKPEGKKIMSILTQRIVEIPKETLVFDTLRRLSLDKPYDSVERWMDMNDTADGKVVVPGSTCYSEKQASLSCRSQILQDHFALLPYATLSFFTHARLAEYLNADLQPVLDRLRKKRMWSRWVALREDLPWGITFFKYITEYEKMKGHSRSDAVDPGPEDGAKRSGRRSWSVASFSSAGSYA